MSKKPAPIPPPPADGGSYTFDPKVGVWVCTHRTAQPYEPEHEGNRPAAAPPVEPSLKDA